MTLEEIKAEIEAYGMTAQGTCFSNHKDYAYGLASGLSFALEALEKLEPSWHPYPEEKPIEDTWVLVTFEDNRIEVDHFYCGKFVWWPDEGETITAWMELPKPYKKEVEK